MVLKGASGVLHSDTNATLLQLYTIFPIPRTCRNWCNLRCCNLFSIERTAINSKKVAMINYNFLSKTTWLNGPERLSCSACHYLAPATLPFLDTGRAGINDCSHKPTCYNKGHSCRKLLVSVALHLFPPKFQVINSYTTNSENWCHFLEHTIVGNLQTWRLLLWKHNIFHLLLPSQRKMSARKQARSLSSRVAIKALVLSLWDAVPYRCHRLYG